MKRRNFILALVALSFTKLHANDTNLPVDKERVDCQRKFVNRNGKDVEYEWFGYYGYVQLQADIQYNCELWIEADSFGDELTLIDKWKQSSNADGVFQIRASANTNGNLPWATHHYYFQFKIYHPDGTLVFDTGVRYVEVTYP